MTYDVGETGPAPIIRDMCDQLKVRETIKGLVMWDDRQWRLDPGTHVNALIINILCGRTLLYRVKDLFLEQDVELLFGVDITSNYFNDDVLAATLDRIYEAGAGEVFSTLAFNIQVMEEIDTTVLHGDTTAQLVYGAYPGDEGSTLPAVTTRNTSKI